MPALSGDELQRVIERIEVQTGILAGALRSLVRDGEDGDLLGHVPDAADKVPLAGDGKDERRLDAL